MISEEIIKKLNSIQRGEITEYNIYKKLSRVTGDDHNKKILLRISEDELKHHDIWQKYTQREQQPDWIKVWFYFLTSKILGITFGIKFMEKGEGKAQIIYKEIGRSIPEAMEIADEESRHENELIQLIDEERLKYIGSVILGLNDALVELSGTIAGLTLALQNSQLVAMTGLITGIAASLSMASTGYLTSKTDDSGRAPLKSALYTGLAYIVTVLFLVSPFLVISNVFLALAVMLFNAILIIVAFNFYISVAKELSFWKRFSEMAILSLGIATISFGIGYLVRELLGVEI